MTDSAAECDLESDTSSVDGFKCGGSSGEQAVRRIESLQQENRVLKTEVEALKLKIKGLNELNQQLRRNSVIIQAKAEQEEEYISNTLLKKITELKKEKESLALNYEQEEECLTNELNRKFTQLRQEKVALERTLAREQEDQVNKLKLRIEKLENDMNNKQTCLDRLRREKIELENALEQEQEALVNRLWKKMEKLEAEKRTLQEKLESLGSLISGSSSNQSLANISQQQPTASEGGGGATRSAMDTAGGSIGAHPSGSHSTYSSRSSLHIQLPQSPQPSVASSVSSQLANSNSVLLLNLNQSGGGGGGGGPTMSQSLLLESSTIGDRDVAAATSQSMNIVLPQSPMDLDVDHNASGSTSPICGVPSKKMATTGQKPGIQRSGAQNPLVGFDTHVTASYVDQLRYEVCRLRQLLAVQEAEHSRKIPAYESEEQSVAAENLQLRRMLQIEKERREMLSRQLSESESSLEMDDERHFNEACRSARFRTISDSVSSQQQQPNSLYGPGCAYAAAVASCSTSCQSCGQRIRGPNSDDFQTTFSANSSIGHHHGFASPRATTGIRHCLCSPDKACTIHHLSASPSTPTTSTRSSGAGGAGGVVGFLKPSNRCSIQSTTSANEQRIINEHVPAGDENLLDSLNPPRPYRLTTNSFSDNQTTTTHPEGDHDDDEDEDDARCATPPLCQTRSNLSSYH